MNPYDLNPGGDEPRRWLAMAEKLLNSRDLLESKSFATRARESDPNLEEADRILAIVDTLIAGEKQLSKNHLDWYAILRLARRTHDMELIASQYRRLSVLLNPNRNKFAFAEHAFKLVTEAWLVLSDPAKKFQFDNEFGNSSITKFNFMQQHFEPPPLSPVKQQHHQQDHKNNNNNNHNSSSGIHIDIMQEDSEQLHQTMPMQQQFVQRLVQQQLFPAQPVHSYSEAQQWQQYTQPLSPQLHWSNQSQQTLSRPQPQQPSIVTQPKQTWLEQPLSQGSLPQSQPEEPLHWSQNVPPSPPLSQPQPGIQQPLPRSQIQESSPEPRSPPQSQPEKSPPKSQEQMENGGRVNLEENGNDADNHDNNVNLEEPPSFWTVCAYCYNMYEYPGIYSECTLQCQNCKKAFHAVRVEAPPIVAEGKEAYIFCWGFFPIGVSTSYLEKRKAEALSWTPFSKMYAFPFPKEGNIEKPKNVRKSGPRTYVDDDGEADIFDGISSNEESDEDWRRVPKNKKARSFTRKVYATRKAKQAQVYREDDVQGESDTENLQSGAVTQEGSGVSMPDAEVLSVLDAEVSSVPVAEAKKKMAVPTRKQPGRVAKDLRD